MDKDKAIELLNKALGCVQTDHRNCGECKKCENYATKEDGIEAIRVAIAALEKAETNCPEIPDSWIPVTEKMPEEKINPNTQDFEEVLCSTTFGDVRAYKFGTPLGWKEPHFWYGPGKMDEYVVAWMPLPEPMKKVSLEPWEGEADGQRAND